MNNALNKTAPTCPACYADFHFVGNLSKKDFDGSAFNVECATYQCPNCQLVRMLAPITDQEILEHYKTFILYSSLTGIGVGGQTKEDIVRYQHYAEFMRDSDITQGELIDIGCSRGGFIAYLSTLMPNIVLGGIDPDMRSVSQAKLNNLAIQAGTAFTLPFTDNSKDCLSYFHVLEHIYDVDAILKEANRVLKNNGCILIEVPDAERYPDKNSYVGPMYWLGLQEHVNHFSMTSLTYFLANNGFEMTKCVRTTLPMKGEMSYPSLLISARKLVSAQPHPALTLKVDAAVVPTVDSSSAHALKQGNIFTAFFEEEKDKMQRMKERILDLKEPFVFWGIGLEFFALWATLGKDLAKRKVFLVDRNDAKIGLSVDGIPIENPNCVSPIGNLICSAYISVASIKLEAKKLGWSDDAIHEMQGRIS